MKYLQDIYNSQLHPLQLLKVKQKSLRSRGKITEEKQQQQESMSNTKLNRNEKEQIITKH